jgi:hypothetical protein
MLFESARALERRVAKRGARLMFGQIELIVLAA